MKKILLLLLICIAAAHVHAQQKNLDSLLNELKKHSQEDTVRLNLLHNISVAYQSVNPTEGINRCNEGINLARKLKNKTGLGNALSSKGINYLNKGEYDSSLLILKTALQIFEKENYEHGMFSVLNTIGVIQYYTANYAEALNTHSKNLRMAERVYDTGQVIVAVANLGLVNRALSNYTEALEYDLKAINLTEKANIIPPLSSALAEAGFTYRELKETEKAQQYFQKSLNICIQTGNKQGVATMLAALGQISADKKDYQQAFSYYQRALSVSKNTGNIQTAAAILGNIGNVYKSIANYPTAIDYYKKALIQFQKLGDKNNAANTSGELGNIYTLIPQEHKQALSYLQQSLAVAKEIGSLDRQETALNYLSNFYKQQKNYQQALSYNNQAKIIQDSIFNDNTKTNITRLEMQYQFAKTQDSTKAITDKQQALAKAEIQKQHVTENATMAGAAFLILAGIGSFVFYKRNRDIRTQKNEAELQAQVSDTEMKALRAQMNPHFIFNSLNSIANYIRNNQTKIAADFTDNFAWLMRIVLENSEYKDIPLADDLKALELYMQLERFRLQNKFDYHIQVDESIDRENTLVPPLMLQPFVENSIWHGMAEKEGKGHITIHIKLEGDMLRCIVEDDGDGINEPAISEEKKSLGIKITKARIDILNKLKNAGASMSVSSKKTGVRAEVKLPLELSF